MKRNWAGETFLLILFMTALWSSTVARAQDDQRAQAGVADSDADSTGVALDALSRMTDPAGRSEPDSLAVAIIDTNKFFQRWKRDPSGTVRAEMRKVQYTGGLNNTIAMKKGASLVDNILYSYETFRQQEKTIERRENSFNFSDSKLLPFKLTVASNWNWSEDQTVNSLGASNLTARDHKMATLNVSKEDLETGFLNHTVSVKANIDDQKSESQNQRNDFTEGKVSGGLQSGCEVFEGISVASRLYGQTVSGDRALGQVVSPSSATTDTLGFGVYMRRGVFSGTFDVARASFEKRYLDFRRNANGLVDTMDPDVEKIVQELEQKDALALRYHGDIRIDRYHLKTEYSRLTNQHEFLNGGQGLRERLQDTMKVTLSFSPTRHDSISISYKYEWKWDNQRLKGAELFRGRQYDKRRNFDFQWNRKLFANTDLVTKWHQGLTQTVAENQYNDNDRDRLSSDFYTQLKSTLGTGFNTTMVFNAKRIEDLSIREARSSGNNIKDTIELAPGYQWMINSWLSLNQTYRIYIQFTDYLFSNLESVRREDDYNKRGSLATRVTVRPTSRLTVTAAHEGSGKSDANRTRNYAYGNDYYNVNKEQKITRMDLTVRYDASSWLTFEGATNRTWDSTDAFGTEETTTTERNGGRVWLGCNVSSDIGRSNPLRLDLKVKKYRAYGPNVRDISADYWDADVSVAWTF